MDASKLLDEKSITQMDWQQVVLNGGPPCFFFILGETTFCGRAERWEGHGIRHPLADHQYVSLDDYITSVAREMRDACVEKVKALLPAYEAANHAPPTNALREAITALESLTLDQVQEKRK